LKILEESLKFSPSMDIAFESEYECKERILYCFASAADSHKFESYVASEVRNPCPPPSPHRGTESTDMHVVSGLNRLKFGVIYFGNILQRFCASCT
jgi:hypothetical protein